MIIIVFNLNMFMYLTFRYWWICMISLWLLEIGISIEQVLRSLIVLPYPCDNTSHHLIFNNFWINTAQSSSESEPERVQPRKLSHSNHYWFVDVIDKIFCFFFIYNKFVDAIDKIFCFFFTCNKFHCTWNNVFDIL